MIEKCHNTVTNQTIILQNYKCHTKHKCRMSRIDRNNNNDKSINCKNILAYYKNNESYNNSKNCAHTNERSKLIKNQL